ncbi:MAG TPA: hypothetical protein VKQ08_08225, partial [Cyclobacteriaceae bacterium]|nr:hypothetical protein [Cyclobacteriaceae bacterium]
FVVSKWSFNLNNTIIGPTFFSNIDLTDFNGSGVNHLNDLQVTFNTRVLTDIAISFQLSNRATLSINANNIFDVLPQWHYKAISPAGQSFLSGGTDANGTTLAQMTNAITFNGRYPYTTYDGSQFSQFGTTFLGQLIYKF